jgi:hypothetical protein
MPKNIVLLSDGTGNSSAQLLKTNVWRVYESLDLTDPARQVACYDDGVGTSTFAPLAIAGGAFGVGLRRNVLRLYRFLCEHYDPGDRIYLFGFSRGAFTIRVLVGLICDQGIVKTRPTLPVSQPGAESVEPGTATDVSSLAYGTELGRLTGWAYREFRRQFAHTGGLVLVARWCRDVLLRLNEKRRNVAGYRKDANHQIDEHTIDFVGVWDTVDAYGLPMDELTDGVDRWIWPLSMPDLALNPKVGRACHVLALDDERNTFHPVLWDESKERPSHQTATTLDEERISQVWFAGMHSNVGGGYPDDALAHVSLKWMVEQATSAARGLQLRVLPGVLAGHAGRSDVFGRVYDSRQGLKSYYRYNPRRIEWLTQGQRHEHGHGRLHVTVPRVKIHESVFERIAAAPEAYAPIVLPEHYSIVTANGRFLDGANNPYERPAAASRRVTAQEAAWDLVWIRRVVYFATVALSLWLVCAPLADPVAPDRVVVREPMLVSRAIAVAATWLPAFVAPWARYYQSHPVSFIVGVGVLLLLMRWGSRLQARICHTMRGIWLRVVPPAHGAYEELPVTVSRLTRLRGSRPYQSAFAFLRLRILPNVFGVLLLVVSAGLATRAVFEAMQLVGAAGCSASAGEMVRRTAVRHVRLGRDVCTPLGLDVQRGGRYRLRLEHARAPQEGASSSPGRRASVYGRYVMMPVVSFRRVWTADWLQPIVQVGRSGVERHPVDQQVEFTAETDGALVLYVNDLLFPFNPRGGPVGWGAFYANNSVVPLTVTVTPLSVPD